MTTGERSDAAASEADSATPRSPGGEGTGAGGPPGPTGRGPEASNGILWIVFTTILIDWIGFSILIPVLPHFADRLGASPTEIGLLLTVYALAQLLFLPAWGWVSDRVGRRPVLLVSLAGTAASFTVLAGAEDLLTVYASRALAGFFAASVGTAQAVVADVTPPDQRARGMGIIGAAFGAAMVLGPALGGLLAALDERAPFYAVAGLALVNLGAAFLRLPETSPPVKGEARVQDLMVALIPTPIRLIFAVHEKRLAIYLYLFFHLFSAFAILEAMITYYLGQRFGASEIHVGLIFAWIGVVLSVTQGLLLRRLVERVGEVRLIAPGLLFMGIGLGGVAVAPSLLWLVPIGLLIAVGTGIAFPSFTALYSKACAADQAGELLAQSQAMATTGRIVGPMLAGYAMSAPDDGTPFLLAGGLMIVALGLFLALRSTLLEGLDS